MARVGFVGLGTMGAPMAGHLLSAGHHVRVWNRTPAKAQPLADQGADVADSLARLAADREVVCLCVNRSEDVRQGLEAMVPSAPAGTLFIDHSTIAPLEATRLHSRLAEMGHAFLDAPVTGGSMGAQRGELTVFCGGEEADFERAKPILDAYAKRAERVGGPGAGQTMKVANQVAVGGALLALCESLSYAKKAGLDLKQTRDLLASGAAGSWAMDNYGPKILAEDWSPGFSVRNQRKDFGYALEAAEAVGACLPGTRLVDDLLSKLDHGESAEWTTAALFKVLMECEPE